MMKPIYFVPLALFAFFAGLAGYMLTQEKNQFVESRMVGEPLPEFTLPPAAEDRPGVAISDFRDGTPKLLNVWASWCGPCIAEAPQLDRLKQSGAEIIGVAIRDRPEDVAGFLAQHGNPYSRIGADDMSALQLELGSSGVPETFVIDGRGIIRHQHIGDIRAEHVPLLLQKLEDAR